MSSSDRAQSVVAFGGGHGLSASLHALRLLVADLVIDELTAVVTVADNGGSSGGFGGGSITFTTDGNGKVTDGTIKDPGELTALRANA